MCFAYFSKRQHFLSLTQSLASGWWRLCPQLSMHSPPNWRHGASRGTTYFDEYSNLVLVFFFFFGLVRCGKKRNKIYYQYRVKMIFMLLLVFFFHFFFFIYLDNSIQRPFHDQHIIPIFVLVRPVHSHLLVRICHRPLNILGLAYTPEHRNNNLN